MTEHVLKDLISAAKHGGKYGASTLIVASDNRGILPCCQRRLSFPRIMRFHWALVKPYAIAGATCASSVFFMLTTTLTQSDGLPIPNNANSTSKKQFVLHHALPEDKRAVEGLAVDSPILKQISFWVIPWRQALKAAIDNCGHAIYKMSHLGHVGYQAYIKNRFHLLNVLYVFLFVFFVFLFFLF